MRYWNIMELITPDSRSRIREWYNANDEIVQAAFDTRLDVLSLQRDWFADPRRAVAKRLSRKHTGLVEIILEVQRNDPGRRGNGVLREQHRPVGFFYREPDKGIPGAFVLIAGCKKTGGRGNNTPVFDEALELLRKFNEDGEGEINDLIF